MFQCYDIGLSRSPSESPIHVVLSVSFGLFPGASNVLFGIIDGSDMLGLGRVIVIRYFQGACAL